MSHTDERIQGRWLRTVEKASDKIQYLYFITLSESLGRGAVCRSATGNDLGEYCVCFILLPREGVLSILLSTGTVPHCS